MSLQGMPAEVLGSSLGGRPNREDSIRVALAISKECPEGWPDAEDQDDEGIGHFSVSSLLGHMPQWRSPQSLHLGAKSFICLLFGRSPLPHVLPLIL